MSIYQQEEKIPPLSLWRLTQFLYAALGKRRWLFAIAYIFSALAELSWLYPPYAINLLVNHLTGQRPLDSNAVIWIFVLWALSYLMLYGGQYISRYIGDPVIERTAADLQTSSYQHLFLLDTAWHEQDGSGNKVKRVDKGLEGVRRILRLFLVNSCGFIIAIPVMLIVITRFNTRLALTTFVALLIYLALSTFFIRRLSKATRAANIADEDVSGIAFEAVNNIRTVKVIAGIGHMLERITDKMSVYLCKVRVQNLRQRATYTFPNLFIETTRVVLLAYIVYAITQGQLVVGFLALFWGYYNNLWGEFSRLSNAVQDTVNANNSIARLKHMLDEPVLVASTTDKVAFPNNWQQVTLRDISFSYGDNEVLKNLSLTIKRGQKIGIVGLSGAGKSTLFKLLLKEREGFSGSIQFDDTPIEQITSDSYFNHVAVVLQETEVFNFSLRDNITIVRPGTHDEALLAQSLSVSHVNDFIAKLPEGLDTLIGEKGVKLSGGEKQRLGIARAVYKQPELLLLDEATSHLDLESEQKIQDSLHQFFESVTAIVIAHRLTTIRQMDVIVVIEDGQIIEQGSFDELMAKHGRFAELWDKQKI